MNRIAAWLGARYAPWIVIAIGLALAAPALTADFTADDHLHRVRRSARTPASPGCASRPLDLFVFADGDPAQERAQLRDGGLFPWWTDPHLKLAFFRPLVVGDARARSRAVARQRAGAARTQPRVARDRARASCGCSTAASSRCAGSRCSRWRSTRSTMRAAPSSAGSRTATRSSRSRSPCPPCSRTIAGAAKAGGRAAVLAPLAVRARRSAPASPRSRSSRTSPRTRCGSTARRGATGSIALAPYGILSSRWRVLYAHLGYGVAGSGIYLDPAPTRPRSSPPRRRASRSCCRASSRCRGATSSSFYPVDRRRSP